MPLSTDRPLLQALLLGVLLATLIAAPPPAGAAQVEFDADASGTALAIPTASPAVYTVILTGLGSSTLGQFRLDGTHEVNVTTGTLANGLLAIAFVGSSDTISGTYSGIAFATADPTRFDIVGEATFAGGTGRFARAKGRGPFRGELQIRSITPDGVIRESVTLQFDGRLTF